MSRGRALLATIATLAFAYGVVLLLRWILG